MATAPRPRAFRLDAPGVAVRPLDAPEAPPREAAPRREPTPRREAARVLVTEEPAEAIAAADGAPVLPAPGRRGPPWGSILLSALASFAGLAIAIGLERFVSDLLARSPVLGWAAAALLALAGLALVALVGREMSGLWRERRVEALRTRAAQAVAVGDGEDAKAVARELDALTAGGPRALGPSVAEAEDHVMDAADRLSLAERTIVAPLDAEARRAVAAAARQVSLVTALSPRAIVDVAFVLYAAARLLRRVSRIYGGRPGFLGFLRLAKAAFNHLAVTGGVAVGDGLLSQALGLGLAARVSAKLGEGVVNGLMTARFGLAAIEVCRPLPFLREPPPKVGELVGDLLTRGRE